MSDDPGVFSDPPNQRQFHQTLLEDAARAKNPVFVQAFRVTQVTLEQGSSSLESAVTLSLKHTGLFPAQIEDGYAQQRTSSVSVSLPVGYKDRRAQGRFRVGECMALVLVPIDENAFSRAVGGVYPQCPTEAHGEAWWRAMTEQTMRTLQQRSTAYADPCLPTSDLGPERVVRALGLAFMDLVQRTGELAAAVSDPKAHHATVLAAARWLGALRVYFGLKVMARALPPGATDPISGVWGEVLERAQGVSNLSEEGMHNATGALVGFVAKLTPPHTTVSHAALGGWNDLRAALGALVMLARTAASYIVLPVKNNEAAK